MYPNVSTLTYVDDEGDQGEALPPAHLMHGTRLTMLPPYLSVQDGGEDSYKGLNKRMKYLSLKHNKGWTSLWSMLIPIASRLVLFSAGSGLEKTVEILLAFRFLIHCNSERSLVAVGLDQYTEKMITCEAVRNSFLLTNRLERMYRHQAYLF